MKIKLRNPLARKVTTRYWRARAIVEKRHKHLLDKRVLWFDGPSQEAAAKGMRKIIVSQGYRMVRSEPVKEHVEYFYIPMWALAFWMPSHTERYMLKKGYGNANNQ